MARIVGVELPKNKRVFIGLTAIYGIGRRLSQKILKEAGIEPQKFVKDLSEEEITAIRNVIERGYKIEGELRREVAMDIKRLIEIRSYRGIRHERNLPVRGQRTRSNARTRRGKRRTVGVVRKKK